MEKQYRYNYKSAPKSNPQATRTDDDDDTQDKDAQDVRATAVDVTPEPEEPTTAEKVYEPLESLPPLPSRTSMWPIYLVFVLVIGGLIYLISRQFPTDYQECSRFPGSTTTTADCNTFYGKTFTNTTAVAQNLPTTPQEDYNITIDSTFPELEISPAVAGETTKGGLPVPTTTPAATPTPTKALSAPTPTPKPVVKAATTISLDVAPESDNPNSWTKHRYPDQHIYFRLPKNANSNVVRNTTTNITTIKVWSDGNSDHPYLVMYLQPNWSGYEGVKDKAFNYQLSNGHPVIRTDEGGYYNYYFERNSQVFVTKCRHDGSDKRKNTCDFVLKSLQFE